MIRCITIVYFLLISSFAWANTYTLAPGQDVIGKVYQTRVGFNEGFSTIARQNDVGFYQLVEANPRMNPVTPAMGAPIVIPNEYVLPVPVKERKGIVINLAELRLYYFPKGGKQVMTFPIGIGRQGPRWSTPLGLLRVIDKITNPKWVPTASVRKFSLEQYGVQLPAYVPGGVPENPFGRYALRLSNPIYLIHGTNDPSGIGKRVSAGCIRMYPEDIKQLFSLVKRGIPVRIIDKPYKAGWRDGKLFLEAHLPLQDAEPVLADNATSIEQVIEQVAQRHDVEVDWHKALAVLDSQDGYPIVIASVIKQPVA